MQYMTFPSSCSYAGVANMLAQYDIETSDREIALAIRLPYLFSVEGGTFVSGPMLQTSEWFDLFLNPIGFHLREETIPSREIAEYLRKQKTAMLGIKMPGGGKHAVVYTGMEADEFVFLNNKWEMEDSPEQLRLTAGELRQRLEQQVMVATLQGIAPREVSIKTKLKESVGILNENLSQILALCGQEVAVSVLRAKLNTLFRPLFLDGIAMLNLIGETELADSFLQLQKGLLAALRQEPEKPVLLKDYFSVAGLKASVERYAELIVQEMDREIT